MPANVPRPRGWPPAPSLPSSPPLQSPPCRGGRPDGMRADAPPHPDRKHRSRFRRRIGQSSQTTWILKNRYWAVGQPARPRPGQCHVWYPPARPVRYCPETRRQTIWSVRRSGTKHRSTTILDDPTAGRYTSGTDARRSARRRLRLAAEACRRPSFRRFDIAPASHAGTTHRPRPPLARSHWAGCPVG
ncbi:hypothetical protein GALL_526690 [mine drainage metagenome]|uniref:Uncharacterized protein n=1 Tax=mine drainage metagenome TaxID=410659 RepID=A0A1J5P2H8_9ZZZZ